MPDQAGDHLAAWVRIAGGGHTVYVTLAGELDVSNAAHVQREIDSALGEACSDVVVDASEVDFVDVDGLNLLGELARRMVDEGGALRLRGPNPLLVRMLQETGLDGLLAIEP